MIDFRWDILLGEGVPVASKYRQCTMMDSDDDDERFASLLRACEAQKQHLKEMNDERKRNVALRMELEKALKEKDAQKLELQEVSKGQKECLKKKDDELAQLRGENARLQGTNSMLTTVTENLQTQLRFQGQQLNHTWQKLHRQAELIEYKEKVLCQLQDKLTEAEKRAKSLQDELKEQSSENTRLEAEVSRAKAKADEVSQRNSEMESTAVALQDKYQQLLYELSNANKKAKDQSKEINELRSERVDQRWKIHEVTSLRKKNEALKARLVLVEAYISSQSSIQDLRTQLQQSQVVIKGYSDREDVMVRDLAGKDCVVAALREQLETLSRSITRLKESNSKERTGPEGSKARGEMPRREVEERNRSSDFNDLLEQYNHFRKRYNALVDSYRGALQQIAGQEQSQHSHDLPLALSARRDKRSLTEEESGGCGGPATKNRRVSLEENHETNTPETSSWDVRTAVSGTSALPVESSGLKMTNTQAASNEVGAKASDRLEAHVRGPLVNEVTPRLEPTLTEIREANTSRKRVQLDTWYHQLERLYVYHQEHGHFQPPRMSVFNCLGSWAADQRKQLSGENISYLTPGKLDALKQIGFV